MTLETFTLAHPLFAGRTGSGVRVAVIDSGIQSAHPHVAGALPGVHITEHGEDIDTADRIGHGTAVAAAIREKAPGVELLPIRVFDRELKTTADVLARAIVTASSHGARLINVSLGTANPTHHPRLRDAVDAAARTGAVVVSPREADGLPLWPGALEGVGGVILDEGCARDVVRLGQREPDSVQVFHACGLPRPIPGVPPARNLQGVSFAVAIVTGFLARLLEAEPGIRSLSDALRTLTPGAPS
ncbi:MAG: S8 family serine peptidase [Gemmatimonadetes bacterium]|nr:S8 family serine peptidase [Gemmatimonadota bacterium]